MDKISKIIAAAMMASGFAYVTPALAVDTTAEEFVIALSSDFSQGDHALVLAKLTELKSLGFDGIMFDNDQIVSIDDLIALLEAVQNGTQSGSAVAAMLLAYLRDADLVRFVMGGLYATVADLNVGTVPGSIFPAGSAG
jgi:hypothetical protein